jgi:hypothetical protein
MDVKNITIEVKSDNIINAYDKLEKILNELFSQIEELKKENEFLKKKLEET